LADLRQYTTDSANWQQLHSHAAGGAEGLISNALDLNGQIFKVKLPITRLVFFTISIVLTFLSVGIRIGKGGIQYGQEI
jgi:hypothetical protein